MRGRKPTTPETRQRRGEWRRGRDVPVLIGGRKVPPPPASFLERADDTPAAAAKRARLREIYRDEAGYLAGAGVLDAADGPVLAALVVQLYVLDESIDTLVRAPNGLLTTNSQGVVPHPLIAVLDRAGKEIRQLSEELPLSPWGRSRLNLHGSAPGGPALEDDLGPARLTVVAGGHA